MGLTVYVLVAILKKQLGLDLSLHQIPQILSVTVFEKTLNSRGVFQLQRRDHRYRALHPVESIRLLMGQHCPALKTLGLKQAGMHALRRGCNRRWELAGIKPAVLRQ